MKTPPVISITDSLGTLEDRELVSFEREDRTLLGRAPMPNDMLLELEATQIRQERTGVHTRIAIKTAGHTVAFGVLNAEKDEDRVRLANSAMKRLRLSKEYGEAIKLRLDFFCERLWSVWTLAEVSEWSNGEVSSPIRRLLSPYVLEGAGTIVFGRKGRGKSYLGILWTLCLQHGLSTSWWEVPEPVNSLFVNLERPKAAVNRRIQAVGSLLGTQGMRSFHARGKRLADIWDPLRAEIHNHGIECVIVDSLSRSGTGDLNRNDDSNQAMDLLNALGCAWVALGHIARGDETHLFGSVMQENAADVMVSLQGIESSLKPHSIGCRLKVTDANDIARPRDVTYALDFDAESGLTAIRQPQEGEFGDLTAPSTPLDQIVAYLDEEGKGTVGEIAEATGISRRSIYEYLKSPLFVRIEGGRGKGVAKYGLAN